MAKQSTALESLKYSMYLIYHPFKAFWDLKHAKKGNLKAAHILFALFIIFNVLSIQFSGNILRIQRNIDINNINVLLQVTSIMLPVLIWCVANWAVTTLLDGEGTIRDIYISTVFSLTPYVLFSLPLLVLANYLTRSELSLYAFLLSVSIVWSVFLLLIGNMTLHQYTMSKTIVILILTIVTMLAIVALGLLFLSIIMRLTNFIVAVITEIRMM